MPLGSQEIDFEGFKVFMQTFLESELSQEFCQHLFLSFSSKAHKPSPSSSDRPRVPGESATRNTPTAEVFVNNLCLHISHSQIIMQFLPTEYFIFLAWSQRDPGGGFESWMQRWPVVLAGTLFVLHRVTLV